MTKDLEKLTAKEPKLQNLINKGFLLRDLFLGLVIFCAVGKVLGLILPSIIDIWMFSIIITLGSTTVLRKLIYKDRLKSVQLKIKKLSK